MNPCPVTDAFHEYTKWSSFIPALMACSYGGNGPILELGVGHFSTPLLHAYCDSCSRKLISIEDDPAWVEKFAPFLSSSFHRFLIGNYETLATDVLGSESPSVSLIDNSHPSGGSRLNLFKLVFPKSVYTLVHDYHAENERDIGPVLQSVKWAFVCDSYLPPTLVASDLAPIPCGLRPMGHYLKSP